MQAESRLDVRVFALMWAVATTCCIFCPPARGAADGLILHYTFAEGAGPVVLDHSGHDNRAQVHGATWEQGAFGSAMRFDGEDDYLDGGIRPILERNKVGSIVVWIRPDSLRGGLVTQSTGQDYGHSRMVLAFKGTNMTGLVADGKLYDKLYFGDGVIEKGRWLQIAYTFGDSGRAGYVDGVRVGSHSGSTKPAAEGLPLIVGRSELYKSGGHFRGSMADVRIYDRALSDDEILELYEQQAGPMGKDVTLFRQPGVEALTYPEAGKVVAFADLNRMRRLLPGGGVLKAAIHKAAIHKAATLRDPNDPAIVEGQATIRNHEAQVILDASELAADDYVVAATAMDDRGRRIGETTRKAITWRGRPARLQGAKVLNNFAIELLNQQLPDRNRATFRNPRRGWVFVSVAVDTPTPSAPTLTLDGVGAGPLMARDSNGGRTFEAIRHLDEGDHEIGITWEHDGPSVTLVVRAIPEIQYVYFPRNPKIKAHGPYDWEFLSRDVLPNVATLVTSTNSPPHLERWKSMGRKWISITPLPKIKSRDTAAQVEEAFAHWTSAAGMTNPLMSGIIVDEFTGGDLPIYDVYRRAVERISDDARFSGRTFDAFSTLLYGSDVTEEFARAVVAGGGHICWETYFGEYRTRQEADDQYQGMVRKMVRWQKALPDITRHMIIVLGYMEQPTYSMNFYPSVDFKVGMDMQYRLLATHPVFAGLGGLSQWASSYADEETIRWSGRLYRHYCIEGNTEPLTDDPYVLSHIRNPDFEEGATGWTIEAAETGSAEVRTRPGFGYLQARSRAVGNRFVWMRRTASGPNVFSQPIRNLEPGRLYSMKMVTADHKNLMNGVSEKKPDVVRIELEGVDVDDARSFQYSFPQHYGRVEGPFKRGNLFWMNYHWRVFRAKGTTGTLRVLDWAEDGAPGGPVGQELICNFIELQPYLER